MLYLDQGEYKKTWWVSKPRIPTGKNCESSIVRDLLKRILFQLNVSTKSIKEKEI